MTPHRQIYVKLINPMSEKEHLYVKSDNYEVFYRDVIETCWQYQIGERQITSFTWRYIYFFFRGIMSLKHRKPQIGSHYSPPS